MPGSGPTEPGVLLLITACFATLQGAAGGGAGQGGGVQHAAGRDRGHAGGVQGAGPVLAYQQQELRP